MWFLTLLLFFLILGILVTIHEFGHFIVAKKCGVHIYEFSIGMGPLIFKHMGKDKIQYSIRALPIGGYVQMAGEVEEDDKKVKKDKFMCNKVWWQRILILCAGVTMNFVLALVLLFFYGLIWGSDSMDPVITEVIKDSPMEKAGAREGDVIISVNSKKTRTWDMAQIELLLKDNDNVSEDLRLTKCKAVIELSYVRHCLQAFVHNNSFNPHPNHMNRCFYYPHITVTIVQRY